MACTTDASSAASGACSFTAHSDNTGGTTTTTASTHSAYSITAPAPAAASRVSSASKAAAHATLRAGLPLGLPSSSDPCLAALGFCCSSRTSSATNTTTAAATTTTVTAPAPSRTRINSKAAAHATLPVGLPVRLPSTSDPCFAALGFCCSSRTPSSPSTRTATTTTSLPDEPIEPPPPVSSPGPCLFATTSTAATTTAPATAPPPTQPYSVTAVELLAATGLRVSGASMQPTCLVPGLHVAFALNETLQTVPFADAAASAEPLRSASDGRLSVFSAEDKALGRAPTCTRVVRKTAAARISPEDLASLECLLLAPTGAAGGGGTTAEQAAALQRVRSGLFSELVGFWQAMARIEETAGALAAREAAPRMLAWDVEAVAGLPDHFRLVTYSLRANGGSVDAYLVSKAAGFAAITTSRGAQAAWRDVLDVLAQQAQLLQRVRESGIVLGDHKAENAVVDVGPDGRPHVYLIDWDGAGFLPREAVEGARRAAAHATTAEEREAAWRALSAHGLEPDMWTDLYAPPEMQITSVRQRLAGGEAAEDMLADALVGQPGVVPLMACGAGIADMVLACGGESRMCLASHVWLYGACLRRMAARMAAVMGGCGAAARADDQRLCGALARLAEGCMVAVPWERPSLEWILGQLGCILAQTTSAVLRAR